MELVNNNNSEEALFAVAREVFADGGKNWGRVVALYTFAGCWAVELGPGPEASRIPRVLADYVDVALGDWILGHGGWDGFLERFPAEFNWEKTMMKGLLATGLGLGIVAGFIAFRH
jgi:hypothetical protein